MRSDRRETNRQTAGSLETGNEKKGWSWRMKRISNRRHQDPGGYSEKRGF